MGLKDGAGYDICADDTDVKSKHGANAQVEGPRNSEKNGLRVF